MRLDDWLKYVEQVERENAEEATAAGASRKAPEAAPQPPEASAAPPAPAPSARAEALFGKSPAKAPEKPVASGTPAPAEAGDAGSAQGEGAMKAPAPPARTPDAPVNALRRVDASSDEDLESAKEVVARPADASAGDAAPIDPEDLNLHIPEIEDFLPYLKQRAAPPETGTANAAEEAALAREVEAEAHALAEVDEAGLSEAEARSAHPSLPGLSDERESAPAQAAESQTEAIETLPKHIQALARMDSGELAGAEEIAQKSYKRNFRESRSELLERLLDPPLSLEDAARILNVCPTTVRRYTNRGVLPHFRTAGNQRRFRLSDVIAFMESNGGRTPASKSREASGPSEAGAAAP